MSHRVAPVAWLRVAVHSLRTTTTVAGMTLLLGFGALGVVSEPSMSTPERHIDMAAGPLDDLMQDNRCSFTGFDKSVIPSSAIVRTPEGDTKLVSFDHGWDVFSGRVAGTLVAVCLGPEREQPATDEAAVPTPAPFHHGPRNAAPH
ncbi:hypothetical protein L615_000200000500 [Nocardioides sp. J9]|uniref:hypothetical protein n=1 Tax=Nocardioides sp. J9 TaxID=935844 RepID=UPI00119EBA79|nr:hypothetical protein [Nocardioides sp. J9]TWH00840.1 hypothetical protein L615_000200000500 [Nocardioides sp. J9]